MPTIGTLPPEFDLRAYRGDDVAFTVNVSGLDLTGAELLCQVRRSWWSSTITTTLPIVVDSATDLTVLIPAAVSGLLSGSYVWDLQVTVGGSVQTLCGGRFTVTPDVSRV